MASLSEWLKQLSRRRNIPRHIKEIIRLKGGNEYPEGRKAFKRDQVGTRLKGKLSNHTYIQPQARLQNIA
jgi:hypothetical protein